MFQMKLGIATHFQTIYWTQIVEGSQQLWDTQVCMEIHKEPEKKIKKSDDQYKSEIKNILLTDDEIEAS